MSHHEIINYIELPAKQLTATKAFFTQAFGWVFEDYGEDYTAFASQGLNGGFFRSDLTSTTANGGALVVFYSRTLEATQLKVEQAGGVISEAIFPFPGGRRFQFIEPSGNEFAMWYNG